jgi:N-acetylglucosamine kinase-like BadF-type ATPase
MGKGYEPIIVGIDGGGSRTRGILYKGDKELAQSETGTARVGTVGVVESAERILNLISELITQAKLPNREIDAALIGLAGTWLKEEQLRSQQLIALLAKRERKIDIDKLLVTSDAAIALEAAFEGEDGIVLIVGTGTIAIAKTPKGEFVRCGGWGIELSDEGSGAWIGREGLTAMARAFDGRGEWTAFADMMIKFFPTINPAIPRTFVAAYNERAFDYSTVTPFVMECATNGDAVCLEIIDRAREHLIANVTTLYKKHFKGKKTAVACVGGIMEADTILAQKVKNGLSKQDGLKVVEPKAVPLFGAVNMARELLAKDQAAL